MTNAEIEEYHNFYTLLPFGQLRHDFNAAQITAMIANVNRKKGSSTYKPSDFMPYFHHEADFNKETKEGRQAESRRIKNKLLGVLGNIVKKKDGDL